jgi:formate dehydrogenase major subunit
VDSVCPYCGVGCQLTYQIKDDKIVAVQGRDGPSNQERLCVKGRFGFDYVHHADRLTVPLIRKDGVSKHDVDIDPLNPLTHFREATWEEAMETGRGRSPDHSRTTSAAARSPASAPPRARTRRPTSSRSSCAQASARTTSTIARALPRLVGCGPPRGRRVGRGLGPFMAAKDADVIVVIGANPIENHPVAATFFKNAVERGAKLIVMDPRGVALKRFASHMLQFKPGRDVSMLNAILHTIRGEALRRAIRAGECGRFRQARPEREELSAGRDGEGLRHPAETLREVARVYARAEAAIVFWGMGVSQHIHGTDNTRCLIAMALSTGQIGRPGTGLHPLAGQNNVQGASDAGLIPMFFPDYKSVEDPEVRLRYEELWGTKLDPKRGLTVVEIMDAIHAGDVRGMYIMGENPAMSDPDVQHAREALG